MKDFLKVLEGIKPQPRIPYYTMIRLEGKEYWYRPDDCRGENCCNATERDRCECTGHWEEWDGK